jgi:N6-adenosine-specific RNA methylase IME4
MVRIDSITVGERHRKDMGDIDGLARSIAEIGLLHPVVVTSDGKLIAGQRRIEACRMLGLVDIPVTVVDLDNIMQGERDENTCRKDFAPTEAVAIWQAMESYKPGPRGEDNCGQTLTGTQRRQRAAETTGMSTYTLSKAKAVVDAAEREPERFGDLTEQMDETGKVDYAYKEVKRREQLAQNERIISDSPAPLPEQKFSTIVLDPPWDWGDEGDVDQYGRARPVYGTMPLAEIAAIPVATLAQGNAHIYLWITNRSLPKGFGLLEAWGFRYVTMLTWVKPSIGMGNYFRGSTEHVLFGVRGSLPLLRLDMGTHFSAPRPGAHSAKPDEFFRIVETCSPGPWLEMFARGARAGWVTWGVEAS